MPTATPAQELLTQSLIRHFAKANSKTIDPLRVTQACRRASTDVPPTDPRVAFRRLNVAAEAVGLQLVSKALSITEALRYVNNENVLAVYTMTADGSARWFMLSDGQGGKARLSQPDSAEQGQLLSADEITFALGANTPNDRLEWTTAQPNSTLAKIDTPAGDVNDGPHAFQGHGHGADDAHGHCDHHHPSPLKRVITLLTPDRRDIVIVAVFALAIGLFNLITPVVAMAVVNTAAQQTLSQQVIVLSVALLVALSLAAFLTVLQNVVVEFLQERIFVRVADDLAYRLPRADVMAFDQTHGPELLNRFFDVLTVQKSAATLLLDGVTIVIQIVVGLVLLGFYDSALIGYDIVLVTCLLFMVFVLGRGAVNSAIRESRAKYAVAGWMEELARHPVAFKMAGGPRFALEKTDQLTRNYLTHRQDHFKRLIRQFGFALFLQAAANAALLAIGGYLVAEGRLTLGQLVAAEIVVTLVVASFTKFGKQFESYYDLLAASDKLGHLIDIPLERSTGVAHQTKAGGIEVKTRQLDYTYDAHSPHVLQGLNLDLAPGERVAIMGPNGSGKSTFVELLFGLRQPSGGRIEIDGLDQRDLKLESFREHTAIVQGVEVFEGSVLANVRMGREELSLYDIRTALEQVGLLQSISELPHGLHTLLQTNGAPLSMGQINRMMLARAIVGQPRLLVLDETLDHMDSDIRDTVLPAILNKEAGWTLLVVTHSDDVAKLFDRTLTFDRPVHLTHANHH